MGQPCTLVFDIGKSNKKLFLFDQDLNVISRESKIFPEIEDDDGFPSEDLQSVVAWISMKVEQVISAFDVKALNFATYGASLVNLDENGRIVTPFYNYLKPFPEEIRNKFFNRYGSEQEFSLSTSSPSLGMLNSGLQLYFLKHTKPDLFNKIHRSVHFPQYLSSLFTKQYFTDYTSLGCHTGLWDFGKEKYAPWVYEEGIESLFPPIIESNKRIEVPVKGVPVLVGAGVHDSSANLIPYFGKEPFVLISTGTWSICLNPFSRDLLSIHELEADCLQFLSISGKPVKASRLFLGEHFSLTVQKLMKYFKMPPDSFKSVNWESGFNGRRKRREELLFDHHLVGAERFGFTSVSRPDFSVFNDFKEAYFNLVDELTDIQIASLALAVGKSEIRKVIIDGGFSTNDVFIQMLANKISGYDVFSTSSSIGTATGAAILVSDMNGSDSFQGNKLGLRRHYPVPG